MEDSDKVSEEKVSNDALNVVTVDRKIDFSCFLSGKADKSVTRQ